MNPSLPPILDDARAGRTTSALLTAAAAVVVIAGLRAARPIVVPLLVSVFVAVACAPLVSALRRRRVPAVLAVGLVGSGVVLVAWLVGAVVGASLADFVRTLPAYETALGARIEGALKWADPWAARFGYRVSTESALALLDGQRVLSVATALLSGVGSVLANGALVLLTVVFMLLEADGFPAKLRRAFRTPEAVIPTVEAFAAGVKQYLVIKTLVSLLTGTAVALSAALLRVDFPLLWGLLAFLLHFIPNIGAFFAALPAVLLALVDAGPGTALALTLAYLAINGVLGNFLEPRWMGRGVGLSSLVVFLSLVFWGWVLGPVGLLLAVPLTMTLKIALESRPTTRWAAVLLGPDDAPNRAPELVQAGVGVPALDAAQAEAAAARP